MTDQSIAKLEKKYAGKSYSEFKADLAEVLVQKLSPIQKKYRELAGNKVKLLKILRAGAEQAGKTAQKTIAEVRRKIGLI